MRGRAIVIASSDKSACSGRATEAPSGAADLGAGAKSVEDPGVGVEDLV